MPKEEAYTQALGSKNGTVLLKIKKKKGGFSTKADATAFELLQIIAMLIDEVSVLANVPQEEVLESVVEILFTTEGEV